MRAAAGGAAPARSGRAFDDHISWPTARLSHPDLACGRADGHSVRAGIDGKEKVYGSIP